MSSSVSFPAVVHCLRPLSLVAVDLIRLVALAARPRAALVAENLFLRKQLALFQERQVRPRRADAATRWMMAALSQWFAWRNALVNVQADTLLRWHLHPGLLRKLEDLYRRAHPDGEMTTGDLIDFA